jgi:hypothetical protein
MITLIVTLVLSFVAPSYANTDMALPGYCEPIVVDETGNPDAAGNQGEVDALLGMGWVGDPSDGMEALYAPGCVAGA